MNSYLIDVSLLRKNHSFRRLLIARGISLFSLGLLTVTVPVQVYALTGSSVCVGAAAALDGIGMFVGLLVGGVLSDLYDRRQIILFARSTCGLGFVGLALNAVVATPSVPVIFGLALWDGFFGALGVSALMAAMPIIVGRENLIQAGALGMLVTRFATISSPALGGAVIAAGGLVANYTAAALGTLLSVLTLVALPRMASQKPAITHPLRMLHQAFAVLFAYRRLLAVFAIGTLLSLTTSVRILFPTLATGSLGGGALEIGLMYAAVPLGATLGAVMSGWTRSLQRLDRALSGLCALAFSAIVMLGAAEHIAVALGALLVYGYANAIASLVQYALIQNLTPDLFLGRINSLGAAQDVAGDSIGVIGIGALVEALPKTGVMVAGLLALVIGGLLSLRLNVLPRHEDGVPSPTAAEG